MKKLFIKRSKLLFVVMLLESILSLFVLFYFNYLDRLNYSESVSTSTNDIALVVQNMYTSTWWALIILVLALISIFSLIAFIYRDNKFQLISVILWVILLILAINIKDSFINNISTLLIFIPIFGFNVFAYYNQKKLN